MITIKNEQAFSIMRVAGQLLAEMFEMLKGEIIPGVSTLDIDSYITDYLAQHKLVSQSKGYHGYQHVSCISINEVIVHGVPRKDKQIVAGDLVKVDVCAAWQGYCADMARCFFAGNIINQQAKNLVDVAQRSLDAGIAQAVPGAKLSNISFAIQQEVEKAGYGVVRDFAGHGIGSKMHEGPEILNYGKPERGIVIREGMAFAIEPMITQGSYKVYIEKDGWTARTVDKSLSAHVEDTVLVTKHGPQIITRL